MTRLDGGEETAESAVPSAGPRAVLLEAREVPLGGIRAMEVHRLLPQRDLPMVGAWCFLDRFGPQSAVMRVEPHPHIGLQTVTWPLEGDVRHRDVLGNDVLVRRGALNLMTSGAGIAHSEYSIGEDATPLDALQLWVALPEQRRHGIPAFEQHSRLPVVTLDDADVIVVMGEFAGTTSPASAHTPILGAEATLPPGGHTTFPLDPDWEYAIVGIFGESQVHASAQELITVPRTHMLYLGTGRSEIEIESSDGCVFFLLGGEPFADEIVMWWNFVGRTHEEIVAARDEWEADSARFGHVPGHGDERVPAPPLPHVRLTKRVRRL
ncbi:hypothetical protein FHX49_002670 [Microbacterium endophyticum]|uniref:Pirin n=1 Tax=Microbacterium endophyticum TaxID=1526412 RepID=A0A7W4V6E7_9MICO|nr:pirin family protein [Microbacterium endophyticum]MBB2977073.1 hypothetical protein [Microbacterium endophyticum]NIK36133.1 hypothetical protein [Microbacterium endophyticum]